MEGIEANKKTNEDPLKIPVSQEAFDYINVLLQEDYHNQRRKAEAEGRVKEFGEERISHIIMYIKRQLLLSNGQTPNNPRLELTRGDVKYISDLAYTKPTGNLEEMGKRRGYIAHLEAAYMERAKELKHMQPKTPGRLRTAVRDLFRRK